MKLVIGRFALLLLMSIFVVAMNVDVVSWLSFYDEKRFFQLAALVLFVVSGAVFLPNAYRLWLFNALWIKVGLLCLLVFSAASIFYADYLRYALLESSLLAALCVSAVIFAAIVEKDFRFSVFAVVISAVVAVTAYMLMSSVYYVAAIVQGDVPTWEALLYNFSNVRFLNQVQIWLIPQLLAAICLKGAMPRLLRGACWFAAVGWCVLLINAQGAGALLALFVSFSVVFFLGRFGRRFSMLLGWVVLMAWAAHWVLMYGLPELINGNGAYAENITTDTRLSGRGELWSAVWSAIKVSPVLGMGPMHYAADGFAFAMHPHNALLQFAAEWGLVVTTIVCVLVALGFYKWFVFAAAVLRGGHKVTELESIQVAAITASLVGAAVLSMVSGVAVMPLSQLCFVVIVGLACAVYWRLNPVVDFVVPKLFRWVSVISVFLLLAVLLWAVAPDAGLRWMGDAPDSSWPRFWQHGKIGLL